jgi:polysaccharide chain length determinant protein (PEP-CTERM system associated)
MSAAQETFSTLLSYFWGIWRHKWLAIGVAWMVALLGWAYVWRMPEYYVASARIFVDSNSVLRPLLKGLAITPEVDRRVKLMSSTLLTRPNLEKLARMTDLDLQATTEQEEEQLINELRSSINLRGQRGNDSVYDITVTHPEREKARRVAQSLITVFIESSLNEKRDESSGAQGFLDTQIVQYERRLIDAENRLAIFKQQNVDVLPGRWGGDYYSRLEETRKELRNAQLQLQEQQNRRDELQERLYGGGSDERPGGAILSFAASERVDQLRQQLDVLLTRYTERHPEVRQIRALIKDIESQGSASAAGSFDTSSPAYQGMFAMLADTEAGVAELEARVAEYERREEALASKVNQIPKVEAQLKQLDRDYEVVKARHDELLKRRESARISEDVESKSSDVTFRVIDPPFVPLHPSDPNKLLLHAGVLLFALAIGAGISLLVSSINPMVADARTLANITGLPLLGTVTENRDRASDRRDRWALASFIFCNFLLFFSFAGVLFGSGVLTI